MKNKIFEEMKQRNAYWRIDFDKIDNMLEQHLDDIEYLLDTNYSNGNSRMDLNNWVAYISQGDIKEKFKFMYDFCKSVIWLDYRNRRSTLIKDHLDDILVDDETEYGGIIHPGETLGEFLEELNANKSEFISMYDDISVINKQLKDCGIKEIEV